MGADNIKQPQTANIAGMGNVPVASPNAMDASGSQFVNQPSMMQNMGNAFSAAGGNTMGQYQPQQTNPNVYAGYQEPSFKQHPFNRIGDVLMAAGDSGAYAALKQQKMQDQYKSWKQTQSPQAKAFAEIYKSLYGGKKSGGKTATAEQIAAAKKAGATHFDDETGQFLTLVQLGE